MTTPLKEKLGQTVDNAEQWLAAYATLPPSLQEEKKEEMEKLQKLVNGYKALVGEEVSPVEDSSQSKETGELLVQYRSLYGQFQQLLAS